jgi:hypothetical protein
MKIRRILAYRVESPLHEGNYKWSGGKGVTVFDSTVVQVDTDEGITGYVRPRSGAGGCNAHRRGAGPRFSPTREEKGRRKGVGSLLRTNNIVEPAVAADRGPVCSALGMRPTRGRGH